MSSNSQAELAWAEPIVIELLRRYRQPMTVTDMARLAPVLGQQSATALGRLLAGMVARRVVRRHAPAEGRRLMRYDLPPPLAITQPTLPKWQQRGEYKHDRAMQAAIERCRGTRFISMNTKGEQS